MLNIRLWFNIRDYEYDVYSLIRAFYPGCQIAVWAEGEEAPEGAWDQRHRVYYEPSAIRYTLEEAGENCAGAADGIPGDREPHRV